MDLKPEDSGYKAGGGGRGHEVVEGHQENMREGSAKIGTIDVCVVVGERVICMKMEDISKQINGSKEQ